MSVVTLPGWELDNPQNNTNVFRATQRLNRTQTTSSGNTIIKQDIVIFSNIETGNYDIRSRNFGAGDKQLLSYNASTDQIRIDQTNRAIYDQIFSGSQANIEQLKRVTESARLKTFELARVNTGSDPVRNQNFRQISGLAGYKSLSKQQGDAAAGVDPNAQQNDDDPPIDSLVTTGSTTISADDIAANEDLSGASVEGLPVEKNKVRNTKSASGGYLRYPLNQDSGKYDYLKIGIIEYGRSGLKGIKGKAGNYIILPMQPNITDSNGVSWNEDQLNTFQKDFGTIAFNRISDAANASSPSEALQNVIGTFGDVGQLMQAYANNPAMRTLISGYFAGQAVGANLLGRAGVAINNNLELLFNGPKLRSFRYSYRFTPREKAEADVVKKIIQELKIAMAPSVSDGETFLIPPNVFSLEYIKEGKPHPFLNKIKTCALTDLSVNYTPDNTYMTYADGGSMTSYQVEMQFSELEPIYRKDQEDATSVMGY